MTVAAAVALGVPTAAGATTLNSTLTGLNGFGSFDAGLPCFGPAPTGAGPNWDYQWLQQPATSAGPLKGTWFGFFRVFDNGLNQAYIPNGNGIVAIVLPNGAGQGSFRTAGDGSCTNAVLTLADDVEGDPFVNGSLPLVATAGQGALKGLSGSGTLSIAKLSLEPGADADALLGITGDFDVFSPQLSVLGATARWTNLSDYLARRLTVTVTLRNASGDTVGSAFNTRVTGISNGTGSYTGLPAFAGSMPPGSTKTATFVMNNAQRGATYNVGVTVAANDGLGEAEPPVTGPASFQAPLLP